MEASLVLRGREMHFMIRASKDSNSSANKSSYHNFSDALTPHGLQRETSALNQAMQLRWSPPGNSPWL